MTAPALSPCPACGRPYNPARIPPPRVPLNISCACCCPAAECDPSLSDRLLAAYVRGMLFASTEPDGTPLDRNYEPRDVDPETRDILRVDVERFADALPPDLLEIVRADADRAGVDLWLTANGHGAGFWDGDWGTAGDRLTEIVKATVKPRDPYPADDQRIHV